jgi:hypothetical protein
VATRADIRTRARIRADQTDSTFVDDTTFNVFIDEGAKEAWYDLVQAGWPVSFSSVEGTASSQFTVLGISGVVAMCRGVYRKDSGGVCELQRIPEGQRAGLMDQAGNTPAYYQVLIDPSNGPTLELLPAPTGTLYHVDYTLEYPGFANDTTVWYGPARSDELIVLGAAAKANLKEGDRSAAGELLQERAALLEKVIGMASWFDARNPATIRDVNSMPRLNPFDFQIDTVHSY